MLSILRIEIMAWAIDFTFRYLDPQSFGRVHAASHVGHVSCLAPGPQKVCKIIAQSHYQEPKRQFCYVLLGSR